MSLDFAFSMGLGAWICGKRAIFKISRAFLSGFLCLSVLRTSVSSSSVVFLTDSIEGYACKNFKVHS